MSISREDVLNAYRLLLGREPENSLIIEQKLAAYSELSDLTYELLNSDEYNSEKCISRLKSNNLDKSAVIDAYKLLLNRLPESNEIIAEKMLAHTNVKALLDVITTSIEFTNQCNMKIKYGIKNIVKTRAFNHAAKIIYLHIPKTAGSAFNYLANENYGDRVCLSTPDTIDYNQWILSRLVGGHYYYSQYNEMTVDRIFISLLRDPVDRAISLFNYYKNADDGLSRQRKDMGFDPYNFDKTIDEAVIKDEFVNNCQCLYLSGERDYLSVKGVMGNDFFVVGVYDYLDEFIEFLGKKLGWRSIHLPRINVSKSQEYMDEYKNDKKLIEKIHDLNEDDYKLYNFVKGERVFTNCSKEFNFTKFKI